MSNQSDNNKNKPDQKKSYPPRKKYYYRKKRKDYSSPKPPSQKDAEKVSFKKVSIVVPLYNEEESITPLIQEIHKGVSSLSCDYEILFIDDGSTDSSFHKIKSIAGNDKKIRYISFRKNYGKSAALQVGFKHTRGDAIITMDADLQDDPAEIPNLLKKLDEGYDLVSGWKKKRFDPFVKKHSSKFFNFTTRVISGIKIHDFNCGLKAYRSVVVKELNIYGELHRYIPVLAGYKGFRVTEIPVKHHARRYGKTKFGLSRFFKGFVDLITVVFTTRYIQRPMHLFGFFGAFAFLAGIAINAYMTYEKLFLGKHLSERPLLFLGILLIIVGVQFFSVGLLGEIMVHNSQNDKEYVIKEMK